MKNIFKKAHKMAREIVAKYGVNYQVQFSLCLSYLLENKEGGVEMLENLKNLKGTEKQIKWAEEIRSNMSNEVKEIWSEGEEQKYKRLELRDNLLNATGYRFKTGQIKRVLDYILENEDSAAYYIENRKEYLGFMVAKRFTEVFDVK